MKMVDEKQNERGVKEKLEFFFKEKIPVHIFKNDKRFLNGLLIEKKSDSVFILKERKFGLMHIFVSEIFEVDAFREATDE